MSYFKTIKAEVPATESDIKNLTDTVAGILQRVREAGDTAFRQFEMKFDD